MNTIKRSGLLCLTLLSLSINASLHAAPATLAILSESDLIYSQQQIAARNPLFEQARDALIKQAQDALKHPLFSVMDKTLVAASGDKHDYYSFPPYWWPDPDKKNGLPYIRKDGQINPAASSDATDKNRLVKMSNDVSTLTLAWYFTREKDYAEKAVAQVRNWFLNPETRMNPHLQYAQAIPGITDGRGIGIIDSRALVDVVDAIVLLHASQHLSDTEYQQLRAWFGKFWHWMSTSQNGFEEQNWHNNHGTWYDLQAATFAWFSGNTAGARKQLQITQLRRIASHFDNQGRQTAELERTRPWHYSNFNLDAYSRLGRLGDKVGVDLWNFTLDDRNLHKGYAYVAQFINTTTPWPWKDLDKKDDKKALFNMLTAAHAWPDDGQFVQKARWLLTRYPDDITTLTSPLR